MKVKAIITLKGKLGLIDKRGVELLKPIYDDISLVYLKLGFIKVNFNGSWGLVSSNNFKEILKPLYECISLDYLDKGLFKIKLNGKWGLFDKKLKKVVDFKYDTIILDQLNCGIIKTKIGNYYGMIDAISFKEISSCCYSKIKVLESIFDYS